MSDLNQPRQTSASERHRRAILCLMGSTDPMNDMCLGDKYLVLGILADLMMEDEDVQKAILDEFFEERLEYGRRFEAAVREAEGEQEDRMTFLAALQAEVRRMWDYVRAMRGIQGQMARERATTVPGGDGP